MMILKQYRDDVERKARVALSLPSRRARSWTRARARVRPTLAASPTLCRATSLMLLEAKEGRKGQK